MQVGFRGRGYRWGSGSWATNRGRGSGSGVTHAGSGPGLTLLAPQARWAAWAWPWVWRGRGRTCDTRMLRGRVSTGGALTPVPHCSPHLRGVRGSLPPRHQPPSNISQVPRMHQARPSMCRTCGGHGIHAPPPALQGPPWEDGVPSPPPAPHGPGRMRGRHGETLQDLAAQRRTLGARVCRTPLSVRRCRVCALGHGCARIIDVGAHRGCALGRVHILHVCALWHG